MQDTDPRTFGEIAMHARIAQEQLATAQGDGFIAPPDYENAEVWRPRLPGFRGKALSHGSENLRSYFERPGGEEFNTAANHIRFLEHVVERLACQVAEMAERLEGPQEDPYAEKARRIREASEALIVIRDELEASQDDADREAWVSLESAFDSIDSAISTFENPEDS